MTRELLEIAAKAGSVVRTPRPALKGGYGLCIDYADVVPQDIPAGGTARSYASGHMLLECFSTIGLHQHTNDYEIWTARAGQIECNGLVYGPGESVVCMCDETHEAYNLFHGDSIIEYAKYQQN